MYRYVADLTVLLLLTRKSPQAGEEGNGPSVLFIGHPFVCDDPDVFLTVVQTGPSSLYLNAHNVGDEPKTIAISRCPDFVAMPRFKGDERWTWTLPAGGEKRMGFGPPTPWTQVAEPSAAGR